MFINLSNHPSANWGEKQRQMAEIWGEICDLPFPEVDAEAEEQEIEKLAAVTCEKVIAMNPTAVMCQGEFTLTYAIVQRLTEMGICCVAACSKRTVVEEISAEGESIRKSVFDFVKFRMYE